jgi:hypothetical protein
MAKANAKGGDGEDGRKAKGTMTTQTKRRVFTCEGCGQECQTDGTWTEEGAAKEQRENFGFSLPDEQNARVCDACYLAFMAKFLRAVANQ